MAQVEKDLAHTEKDLASTKKDLASTKKDLASTKKELAEVRADFKVFIVDHPELMRIAKHHALLHIGNFYSLYI